VRGHHTTIRFNKIRKSSLHNGSILTPCDALPQSALTSHRNGTLRSDRKESFKVILTSAVAQPQAFLPRTIYQFPRVDQKNRCRNATTRPIFTTINSAGITSVHISTCRRISAPHDDRRLREHPTEGTLPSINRSVRASYVLLFPHEHRCGHRRRYAPRLLPPTRSLPTTSSLLRARNASRLPYRDNRTTDSRRGRASGVSARLLRGEDVRQ